MTYPARPVPPAPRQVPWWLVPWCLIGATMLNVGCGLSGDDRRYCRGRFSVAATMADSAEITKSHHLCSMYLGGRAP